MSFREMSKAVGKTQMCIANNYPKAAVERIKIESQKRIENNVNTSLTISMDRTGSPHKEDSSCPLIQIFYERITEGQWYSRTSGSPDDTTRILLAQLLLDIIQAATNTLLAVLKNTSVVIPEEQVQAKLGETLTQSFAEVLDVEDMSLSARSRKK
ncbi:uncharacterized protein LOC121898093 [Scomber scombrus]|uniref:Uncharacterized protein LOC121898093 n=1 Tax=Scomber scombrus TaxID=13677 RepID=A0AAV1NNW0_SCOSC